MSVCGVFVLPISYYCAIYFNLSLYFNILTSVIHFNVAISILMCISVFFMYIVIYPCNSAFCCDLEFNKYEMK